MGAIPSPSGGVARGRYRFHVRSLQEEVVDYPRLRQSHGSVRAQRQHVVWMDKARDVSNCGHRLGLWWGSGWDGTDDRPEAESPPKLGLFLHSSPSRLPPIRIDNRQPRSEHKAYDGLDVSIVREAASTCLYNGASPDLAEFGVVLVLEHARRKLGRLVLAGELVNAPVVFRVISNEVPTRGA